MREREKERRHSGSDRFLDPPQSEIRAGLGLFLTLLFFQQTFQLSVQTGAPKHNVLREICQIVLEHSVTEPQRQNKSCVCDMHGLCLLSVCGKRAKVPTPFCGHHTLQVFFLLLFESPYSVKQKRPKLLRVAAWD